LLVGGAANYLPVLVGSGDGTFQAPPSYAAGGGPQSVALADFNGDGVADIVTANATSNDVSVLLGSGGSKFPATIASGVGPGASSLPPSPVDLAVADFNADGKPDVAVADEQSNDVSILIGKGDGSFQAGVHYLVGVDPNSLVAADFNGDGKLNLAVLNSGSFAADFTDSGVSILLGNGNGTFQTAKNYRARLNPTAMAVGDVNGDGKLNVIIATQAPDFSYIVLVLLAGDGGFRTPATQPTDYGARAISIADLKLDGKPDLVVAHCCGTTDMIYFLGNGDGTFQPEVHFPGGDSSTAVVVADLSHDGRPDAVITAGGSGGIGVSSVAIILKRLHCRDWRMSR